jgi:RecA-family ATPase
MSEESPDVTDDTVREVLPKIAAELRRRFDVSLTEAFQLLNIVAVDCDSPPAPAEIEQIMKEAYSPDRPPVSASVAKRYSSKLEAALDHTRRGFSVFPLVPNGKEPAVGQWQYSATRDEARIRKWAAEFPNCNWAIVMDGLAAMDVDGRKGGFETFEALSNAENLSEHATLTAVTASGGLHQIYRLPNRVQLKKGADRFGQGIDLQTGSAYLVAPGSTIKGNPRYPHCNGEYRWLNDLPIAPMPQCLVDIARKAGAAGTKSEHAGKRLVEETDAAVEQAEAWIREHAPTAEQGNRDNTAFQVAARLYDYGLEKPTVLDMLVKWNFHKCEPPLEDGDIQRIAGSAGRNRQNPIGVLRSTEGFEAVEIAERQQPAKSPTEDAFETEEREKFYLVRADEMSRRALEKPREWLVENIMYCCDEGELIGKPGEGKSFFALDLGYHIVKGQSFAGNKVTQGPVVYIAAEAQEGIKTRIRALEQHYGPLGDAPFYFIPVAPDLASGLRDAKALAAKIKEAERLAGKPVALFIVDTLSRAMGGRNENAPEVMGAVLNAVRYLRAETGAGSLVIHHPGWNSDHGRGHSSQFGAVDVEMWMENQVVTVRKIRDGEGGYEVAFRRKTITLGFREDGSRITSCYVETGKRQEVQVQPTAGQAEVLEIAAAVAATGKKITIRNIQAEIKERRKTQSSAFSGSDKNDAIRRMLEEAEGKHLVKKERHGQWVIVKAEEAEENGVSNR